MKTITIEKTGMKNSYSSFYHEKTCYSNNKPRYFSLKALLRDEKGELRANSLLCIQLFITNNSFSNTFIYTESHHALTNKSGFIQLQVGLQFPAKFNQIDWMNGPYFMKVVLNGLELKNKILLCGF
jgi:hypothetical protein